MFEINRMNFNGDILRNYCQVKGNSPIWGEVQHSLWESRNFRTWNESRIFPKLFTWNDLLSFPNQHPIGDPYLYLLFSKGLDSNYLDSTDKTVIVVPKFRRRLHLTERIHHYSELMRLAQISFPNHKKTLILHPEEQFLLSYFSESFEFTESWCFESTAITSRLDQAQVRLEIICRASELMTDYFGVHVLRRLVISKRESNVIGEWEPYTGRDSEIQQVLEIIMSFQNSLEERVSAAELLLGKKWLHEKNLLSKALGFTGLKKQTGGLIKGLYKLKNKSKVGIAW